VNTYRHKIKHISNPSGSIASQPIVKILNGAAKNCLITDMATLITILEHHIKSEAYNSIGKHFIGIIKVH
jgi:hypothetical protein